MRRYFRFAGVLVTLFVSAAWADKRDVVIQCAASCDAVVATVARLGGKVSIKYRNVGAVAASVPVEKLAALSASSDIKSVSKDVLVQMPRPVEAGMGAKGMPVVTVEAAADIKVLDAAAIAASSQPNDYGFNNGLIRASPLHAGGNLGQGVIVAVIDSGTTNAPTVQSLAGSVIGGENFVPGDYSATSRLNGAHGTWVGTMIAGHATFGFSPTSTLVRSVRQHAGPSAFDGPCPGALGACWIPVIGSAPLAKIYALKVFPSSGGGAPSSRIIDAMDRVITLKRNFNNGVPPQPVSGSGAENDPYVYDSLNIQVVNMSLGGPTLAAGWDVEDLLTVQMLASGITIVASAGNDGFAAMTGGSPGTGFGSLTVGAASTAVHERILRDIQYGLGMGALFRPTTHTQTADFSSRGPTADGRLDPDVTANGVASFAQNPSGSFSFVSGTSFSGPTVAGAAALLRVASPSATATQIRNALAVTANPNVLGDGSGPIDQGTGFIDVAAAAAKLATGTVSPIVMPSFPNLGSEAVRQNVKRLGFDTVAFSNDKFATRVSNLRPGQVAQFFLRSRDDTTKFVVRLKNITREKPPAQQNQLFRDDVFLQINDAGTSFADARFAEFVAADSTFTVDQPQSGLVRVALQGDWTNGGMVSADLEIDQQRDPLPGHTSKGDLSKGSETEVGIDIPAGTAQAVFELFWENDWAAYPTNDIDLYLVAPNGTVNVAGATLASPERVVLAAPAAGRWTAVVVGADVPSIKDKFTLRVTADGKRLKAAK